MMKDTYLVLGSISFSSGLKRLGLSLRLYGSLIGSVSAGLKMCIVRLRNLSVS
jgi:hypothetical protein